MEPITPNTSAPMQPTPMSPPPISPQPTAPPPMPPQKKKSTIFPIVVLSFTCLVLLAGCVLLAIRVTNLSRAVSATAQNEDQPATPEAGDELTLTDLKERLSSGSNVMSVLKEYYPDNIVYVDEGRYIFADILPALAKNSLKNGTFVMDESGEITYSENGAVLSHKGIDVSQFQGTIDFSKVKNAGVEYAIIRCGYRGYGSGTLVEDYTFKSNIEGALKNDINVGVYFFTQAITTQEAVEEADYVIDKIKPYNVTYPVAIDVEEIVGDTYRQQVLTRDQLTDVIVAFCERVKERGYTPMIYGNLKCLIGKVDLTRLESYDKWFAYYADEPYFPYAMAMWQYSESGSIAGIEGNVDLNISFKTW